MWFTSKSITQSNCRFCFVAYVMGYTHQLLLDTWTSLQQSQKFEDFNGSSYNLHVLEHVYSYLHMVPLSATALALAPSGYGRSWSSVGPKWRRWRVSLRCVRAFSPLPSLIAPAEERKKKKIGELRIVRSKLSAGPILFCFSCHDSRAIPGLGDFDFF